MILLQTAFLKEFCSIIASKERHSVNTPAKAELGIFRHRIEGAGHVEGHFAVVLLIVEHGNLLWRMKGGQCNVKCHYGWCASHCIVVH